MPELFLQRYEQSPAGTFGTLRNGASQRLAYTCERPDNGNQKLGAIPAGQYEATPYVSPSKGRVFLLHDVPGRSMIEIHKGNTIADTEGCILVGMGLGVVNYQKAVVSSAQALANLLEKYPNGFTLNIQGDMTGAIS